MHTTRSTLAHLLPAAAERDPDGVAIRDQGESITWAGAHDRAARLSAALLECGVERGERVGVHYRKCADAFLAMHAVIARGAVAVPLDPTAPVPYLASVVERTDCRVVLTHDECRTTAEGLAASGHLTALIGLTATEADAPVPDCRYVGSAILDELEPAAAAAPIDGSDPAYIITTSGSTGEPKGICHTHASALAYVRFKLAAYDFGSDDRISDIAPNHFDISTQALWVTPAVGATNVVIPAQHQLFPASLSQLVADEALTVWYGVPYLLTQLLARGNLSEHDLSSLRWVLFGGEVFPPQLLARLMAALPDARFSNVYGPAEVNACAIHHLPAPPDGAAPVPIGRPPLETEVDTEIRLVDPHFERGGVDGAEPAIVESGQQGEIWVRASTMMRGYWGQPELTDRSVITWDGARWYRTGDLGLDRADGELVFAGRVDHQVKVRGYRVELESIEAILEDTDGVASAVAAVVRAADGSDLVIAGLVPESGAELDHRRLATSAREQMPPYAVPTCFYQLGSTAVTGSGKLDRRAIRIELIGRHAAERRVGNDELAKKVTRQRAKKGEGVRDV